VLGTASGEPSVAMRVRLSSLALLIVKLLPQVNRRSVGVDALLDLVFGAKLFTACARRIVGALDVADANRATVYRL
jgi:hypothetical protein